MKYKLPEKIRVGAQEFSVICVDELRDGDTRLDGHIVFGMSEIRIDNNLDDYSKYQTLWHEVVHAILTHAGRNKAEEVAIPVEDLCEVVSYGLLGVLSDNPGLCE